MIHRSLTSLITACQQIHIFSLLYLPLTFRSTMWPLHPSIVFTWLRCINLCWHLVVGTQQGIFCSSLITATVLVFWAEPGDLFYILRLWHFWCSLIGLHKIILEVEDKTHFVFVFLDLFIFTCWFLRVFFFFKRIHFLRWVRIAFFVLNLIFNCMLKRFLR